MDQEIINKIAVIQTQLWLGSHDNLQQMVVAYLQRQFCAYAACGMCISCKQINEKQYHAVCWIVPEKSYTLETIAILHEQASFVLDKDQKFFFILEKADFLTTQCANSLLKLLEEPPEGYHFILCAERKESLLPTIISRCTIYSFNKEHKQFTDNPLFRYFISSSTVQAASFFKEIQYSEITEHESLELVDQLLHYWMNKYIAADNDKERLLINKNLMLFKSMLLYSPMPGSGKLFWKNLFLQYTQILADQ